MFRDNTSSAIEFGRQSTDCYCCSTVNAKFFGFGGIIGQLIFSFLRNISTQQKWRYNSISVGALHYVWTKMYHQLDIILIVQYVKDSKGWDGLIWIYIFNTCTHPCMQQRSSQKNLFSLHLSYFFHNSKKLGTWLALVDDHVKYHWWGMLFLLAPANWVCL